MIFKDLLKYADVYYNLTKSAFTAAPPVLWDKIYKIYESAYNEYLKEALKEFKELKELIKSKKLNKRKKFLSSLRQEYEKHPSRIWYDEKGKEITEAESKERYGDKRYNYYGRLLSPERFEELYGKTGANYLSDLKEWVSYLKKNNKNEIDYAINYIKETMLSAFKQYAASNPGRDEYIIISKYFGFDKKTNVIPTIKKIPKHFMPQYRCVFNINKTHLEKEGIDNTYRLDLQVYRDDNKFFKEKKIYNPEVQYLSYSEVIQEIENLDRHLGEIDYLRDVQELLQNARIENIELDDPLLMQKINEAFKTLTPSLPIHSTFSEKSGDLDIIGYNLSFKNNEEISKEYLLQKGDLDGWEYSDLIPTYFYHTLPPISLTLTIGPSFKDPEAKTEHYGYVLRDDKKIKIVIGIEPFKYEDFITPENLRDKVENDLKMIKNSLHHELSHNLQVFVKGVTFGLPPKIKGKKDYDIEGRDSSGRITQEHQFRAIEVYPRLGNSIIRFKEQITSIPKEKIKEFIEDFVGKNGIKDNTDSNFKQVLQSIKTPYDARVYQNMVKEFLSEIGKLGYSIVE